LVIATVRAWLKYLRDKLFDQEGNNPSNSRRKLASRESPLEALATAVPGNGYFNFRKSKLRNNPSAARIAGNTPGKCREAFDRDQRGGSVESPKSADWSHPR